MAGAQTRLSSNHPGRDYQTDKLRRAAIRASIGGWVEKSAKKPGRSLMPIV
jgi:hypothetical protein